MSKQKSKTKSQSKTSKNQNSSTNQQMLLPSREDSFSHLKNVNQSVQYGDIINNKYFVICKLGWGCHSIVWLGFDLIKSKCVALKVIRSEKRFTEHARSEILIHKVIKKKKSPYRIRVVNLLDYFKLKTKNASQYCLVFELLDQNDLFDLIQEHNFRGLPINKIKEIVRQILESLVFLHNDCGIIHTDLKPENVVFYNTIGSISEKVKKKIKEAKINFEKTKIQIQKERKKIKSLPKLKKKIPLTGKRYIIKTFHSSSKKPEINYLDNKKIKKTNKKKTDKNDKNMDQIKINKKKDKKKNDNPKYIKNNDKRVKQQQSKNKIKIRNDKTETTKMKTKTKAKAISTTNKTITLGENQKRNRKTNRKKKKEQNKTYVKYSNNSSRGKRIEINNNAFHSINIIRLLPSQTIVNHKIENYQNKNKTKNKKNQRNNHLKSNKFVPNCKLIDFGNSIWKNSHTNSLIQPRAYRAPEVILKKEYNEKADIWSLGCIIVELLTGVVLFSPEGENMIEEDKNHLNSIEKLFGKIQKKKSHNQSNNNYTNTLNGYNNNQNVKRKKEKKIPLYTLLLKNFRISPLIINDLYSFLWPMFNFDVEKRPSASDLLKHRWIQKNSTNNNIK
ncbi:protein kinase superfamily protein [Anaeramoeba flamelloides]|uniref:non-specific serine/threonine protein kinase n=1 Tax=Anaeramoeba flamelloides TaxID=1746091 RepID=A0AAV7ZVK6_9EUKA|nr:protein kinase superfamily protein [Anaeramoeba flamelloides]